MSDDNRAEEPPVPPLERLGAFLFARRNLLFPVCTIALLAGLPPVRFPDAMADRWMDGAGLLLILAGQALRASVIGLASIRHGGKEGKVHAPHLLTDGLFRHSRNPLYLGNLLVLGGLLVIHNNPWAYALGVPLGVIAYSAIIAAEEAFLRGRFGAAYEEYRRTTPRWFPVLRGLRRTLAGRRFDWWRVINKDYTTTYSWVAAVVALLAYEEIVEPSLANQPLFFSVLVATLGLCSVSWVGVRFVKKTERERGRRKAARA